MNSILVFPVLLPFFIGLVCLLLPWQNIRETSAFMGMLLTFLVSFMIFLSDNLRLQIEWIDFNYLKIDLDFISSPFSGLVLLASSFLGLLITLYSLRQMRGKPCLKKFYIYLLWTVAFANGAILSNNLVVLLIFWGMIAILLYLLISISGENAERAAQKSFIIVGSSDFLMLLGVVIIWYLAGSISMNEIRIPIKDGLSAIAFILLIMGALAKAGAMPFHSWIPDSAEAAPAPVMAFLPASLDKLLGIYLFTRIYLDLFENTGVMNPILLMIGAVTIFLSMMMGLMQNDGRRLIGYLVISGAGYMVLGLGTGNPVGIAGGLLYMMSSILWTPCLFLSLGNVEYRTGSAKLADLGGLARTMPVTFTAALVAVLSISGIPPFNGFASKWMMYQGLIELGKGGNKVWILWLVVAMFGSMLTLALGVKMIHAVFWGTSSPEIKSRKIREVGSRMLIPPALLAFFCIFFGVFAQFSLKYLIDPVLGIGNFRETIQFSGIWSPTLATLLLFISIACGFIFYWLGNIKGVKEGDIFVGGEPIDDEEIRMPGTHFYDTIESAGFLRILYEMAKKRTFDLYEWGRRVIKVLALILYQGGDRMIERVYDWIRIISLELSEYFKKAHTGILTMYFIWLLVGITVMLLILIK